MQRDDHCCLLTRRRDIRDNGSVFVETVHIIPEGTNENITEEDKKAGISNVFRLSTQRAFVDVPLRERLDDVFCVH